MKVQKRVQPRLKTLKTRTAPSGFDYLLLRHPFKTRMDLIRAGFFLHLILRLENQAFFSPSYP